MSDGSAGSAVWRAAARGAIAAMAMTGMRRVTTGFGLLPEPPPEEIARTGAVVSRVLDRVSPEHRDEVVELLHWAYGAAGGAAFGLLWRSGIRTWWAGPAYGLAVWAAFETGLVPILGLKHSEERSAAERAAVVADHVLYGAVVAGRPQPHRT